jgi:hypothetical protein
MGSRPQMISLLNRKADLHRPPDLLQMLWPRLVELWITAVLAVFFFTRVLGSQTAQRILGRFFHLHLP